MAAAPINTGFSGMESSSITSSLQISGLTQSCTRFWTIEINQLEESPALLGAGAYAAQQVLANPGMLIYEADFRSGRASSEAT